MRILEALRERSHVHLVAADFPGNRPEILGRRNHVQLALSVRGCARKARGQDACDDQCSDIHADGIYEVHVDSLVR
jgi:hypothetical protein